MDEKEGGRGRMKRGGREGGGRRRGEGEGEGRELTLEEGGRGERGEGGEGRGGRGERGEGGEGEGEVAHTGTGVVVSILVPNLNNVLVIATDPNTHSTNVVI